MRWLLVYSLLTASCVRGGSVNVNVEANAVHAPDEEEDVNAQAVVANASEAKAPDDTTDTKVSAEAPKATLVSSETPSMIPCGIWLAPSTIPFAGLGMFAGQVYRAGEKLQSVGDVVIPIVDLSAHRYDDEEFTWLFDEYTWNANALKMTNIGYYDVNVVSPGFGSAANSNLPLVNVDEGYADHFHGAAGLHRSRDPGAGAFSLYHNRLSTAKQDIAMGEEFYVDYGNHWFETRTQLGPIPLYEDLKEADKLVRKAQKLAEKLDSVETVTELWDEFVRNNNFPESRILAGGFHHDDPQEMAMLENMSLPELRRQQSFRDPDWLAQHGTCGDHLQAGLSTIPQAGRGAFATRDLPQGTIVAQMPLIHVPDRNRMVMYELEMDEDHQDYHHPDTKYGVMGHQLLLNYCFGHGESTLLLCQYGPIASLINHGSGSKANVKIQWGDPARGNHMPALLEGSIQELESDATAKLAFELVATRDIKQGEEVLLDYGDEWEQAWQEHVKNWKPAEGAEEYKSAEQLNNETATTRLLTVFEQTEEPYPSNVGMNCDLTFRNLNWQRAYENDVLEEWIAENEAKQVLCDILRYTEANGTILYTAMVLDPGENDETDYYLMEDVPRRAFAFFDLPYTQDIFLRNAFRHDIRIPDELFPQSWRNLKETLEEANEAAEEQADKEAKEESSAEDQ